MSHKHSAHIAASVAHSSHKRWSTMLLFNRSSRGPEDEKEFVEKEERIENKELDDDDEQPAPLPVALKDVVSRAPELLTQVRNAEECASHAARSAPRATPAIVFFAFHRLLLWDRQPPLWSWRSLIRSSMWPRHLLRQVGGLAGLGCMTHQCRRSLISTSLTSLPAPLLCRQGGWGACQRGARHSCQCGEEGAARHRRTG